MLGHGEECTSYCKGLHILTQDESSQAVFAWHDDRRDIKGKAGMVTAVVQLCEGESAMRIWSFQPHKYDAPGSCAIFCGSAIHESVPWKQPKGRVVYKVTFFLF